MAKNHLKMLMMSIERLEGRGLIGKSAFVKIQRLRKTLELAIATKDAKRTKELIERISQLLYEELQR